MTSTGNNSLPAIDKTAIECDILNTMRPPVINELNNVYEINGIHFDSILKHQANDSAPWCYCENDKSIGFECKEIQWNGGTSIKTGVNDSIGVVDTESLPISLTYQDAFGSGINVKIIQDNYKWQKIIEIESLEALKDIPADAEYLEISFNISSDFILPEGIINEPIPFGENSFIQPIKAWNSLQENCNDTFGEIKGTVLIKIIPVAWLKSTVYPVQVDTTITFGAEEVFNSAITNESSVAMLDNTHFVVAYNKTAIVGEVSGTTINSYGVANIFNIANTQSIAITALDSAHFVIVYEDTGNGNYGTAIVGEVSGTTINSYGIKKVFNSKVTCQNSVITLDSTHFVIAYQDRGNSDFGTAIVGEVSGTTINSYGAANIFNFAMTIFISIAVFDSTRFIIAYTNVGMGLVGVVIIGEVSGTTITYGTVNTFNSAMTTIISVAVLDSTHFVVACTSASSSSIAIVGEVSGTTISSYGAQNIFSIVTSNHIYIAVLDSTHFVIAYDDRNNSVFGTAVVGEVLGITINYGVKKIFNSAQTQYNSVAAFDDTHFVVTYNDNGNLDYGTAIIGSIPSSAIKSMWYYDMLRRRN